MTASETTIAIIITYLFIAVGVLFWSLAEARLPVAKCFALTTFWPFAFIFLTLAGVWMWANEVVDEL